MRAAPQLNPAPKPLVAIISFCLILLFLIASSITSGIVAAEVLPYFSKLLRIFSPGIFNLSPTESNIL